MSDFEHDDYGRTTQFLGPAHPINLGTEAIIIRRAAWYVWDDVHHVTYAAAGYQRLDSEAMVLVNPVSITKTDAGGRVNEQIQAASAETAGTLAEIIASAGGGAAAFPQASYTRWTTFQYTDCCLAASTRVYHNIPASGEGDPGANYDQTDYGYDAMKRRNRTVTPGGTITDLVHDVRGHVTAVYVGTNDSGGTEDDPTGGGLDPNNNMVLVTAHEYDHGASGGDGHLTRRTEHV